MEPKLALGTLVFAAMLADFILFILIVAGIENIRVLNGVPRNRLVGGDIAWSHGLITDVLWGALFAAGYFLLRRHVRAAWTLFAAVASHWVLDWISHRPDMAIGPGVPGAFGLGLWNSIPATLILEGGAWIAAIIVYLRLTRAEKRAGVYAFWAGVAVLSLAWIGNITVRPSRDPGASQALTSLIFFSLSMAWAFWMDRTRTSSGSR
jgi:hypothetical protein